MTPPRVLAFVLALAAGPLPPATTATTASPMLADCNGDVFYAVDAAHMLGIAAGEVPFPPVKP